METINSLPVLGYLNLDRAGVTNEELARLPATLHLKSLVLIGKELTDEGLAGLRVDPERLVIQDTRIERAKRSKRLRSRIRCRKIELYNHSISPERVRYLNTWGGSCGEGNDLTDGMGSLLAIQQDWRHEHNAAPRRRQRSPRPAEISRFPLRHPQTTTPPRPPPDREVPSVRAAKTVRLPPTRPRHFIPVPHPPRHRRQVRQHHVIAGTTTSVSTVANISPNVSVIAIGSGISA